MQMWHHIAADRIRKPKVGCRCSCSTCAALAASCVHMQQRGMTIDAPAAETISPALGLPGAVHTGSARWAAQI